MKSFKSTLALAFLCFPILLFAQKGTIRGQVIDGENGEPLFAANAVIKGTQIGTTTDFDGNYTIKPVDPGNYTIKATFVGYGTVEVTGVIVSANKITFQDLKLQEGVAMIPVHSDYNMFGYLG